MGRLTVPCRSSRAACTSGRSGGIALTQGSPLSAFVRDWVYPLGEELAGVSGLLTGLREAHQRKGTQTEVTILLTDSVSKQPGPVDTRTAIGDLEIYASAVMMHPMAAVLIALSERRLYLRMTLTNIPTHDDSSDCAGHW
jgi:hypothetical protein